MPTAWAAKTWLKLIFFVAQTDAAASSDRDGLIVKRIVDVRQSLIGAGGGLIDLGRGVHIGDW